MPYLDKSYTKEVRQELRSRYPDFKFSVRTRDHMALSVTILSGPLDLLDEGKESERVNHYYIEEHYEDSPQKAKFLSEVLKVMERGHNPKVSHDGDYGNIPNFYMDLNIGKWDRPYEVKS